jgi:Putative phage tail protein
MATIVLSAVGAIVGGPIGAAVGAVIGQQVDNVIFAPGRRQGPRLGDLALQTSSYGSAIPKLFGTVRMSGTVIWATDLKESRTRQSNGKGRGSTDVYSYSASFAVALSGRPISGIGRIWADGKLLRGSVGDFKSETGFRFYAGDEGQGLDPLIAASEGIAATPAYRGMAYAVFEDMALGTFGNRIPSLSFEVVADVGGTSAGAVIAGLSVVTTDGGPALGGLAATGDSVRGVAETIAQTVPFSMVGLNARFGAGPMRTIAANDLGTAIDKVAPRHSVDRIAVAAIPEVVTLGYNDVGRDYLIGSQRARRDGASRREVRVELPAALDAAAAKTLAEARLTRFWAERSRASVTLPWRMLTVGPGDMVVIPDLAGMWRVARVTFEAMVVRLDLMLQVPMSAVVATADAGRNRAQIDLPHGPTTLQVIDLPQLSDAAETSASVVIAANGATGGWRRASLMTSIDGGVTYADAGSTALPAIMGQTVTVLNAGLGAGETALIDRVNSVEVQMIHAGLSLHDADGDALLGGENLAMIGDELVQFGRAEPLGNGRWRLSELWRGRRGTEWAAGSHAASSPFVLIEAIALAPLPVQAAVGGVRVMATGVGDPTGVVAVGPGQVGAATRPLTPVAMTVVPSGGDVMIGWTRRSRDGWRWADAIEVPLAEESERYRVTKIAAGRADLTIEVAGPTWTYTSAERSADLVAGAATAVISVVQVGASGVSHAAAINVSTS